MKLPAFPWRRNAAVIAAAAIVGALGIGGVMSAQADTTGGTSKSTVDRSDGDGEQNDATETQSNGDGEQNDATEPQSNGDGEQNDATEAENDAETNDDATDTGPDANPNEP